MTARYWVLASDELMDSGPQWPPCLRPVRPANYEHPGMRWWLFEDDDAPDSLDGKRIELDIRGCYDKETGVTSTEIAGRRPAP